MKQVNLARLFNSPKGGLDEARSCALRLELNSLRSAEQARVAGDPDASIAAIDQALALARADTSRWGDAWPLLDEQLRFYSELLRVPELADAARARRPFVEPTTGMVLAPIATGSFLMGSPDSEPERDSDEGPQHRVTLSHDFWIGIHPVTQPA